MKLKDQHAIITGGNRGLGAQIARNFVAEGASVLLCARDIKKLEEVANSLRSLAGDGQQVLTQFADVSCKEDIDALVDLAQESFPSIEILVNCAGVCGPVGPVEEMDLEEWREAMRINIDGTVYPCMRLAALMKARGYGKIINISGGGATKPLPHLSAYAASKAATVRFSETLAVELAPHGIDVNAVAPGVLATGLVDEFVKAGVENLGQGYMDEVARQKKNALPAMDQAAGLCVYLASRASDGITGKLVSAVWDPWENLETHLDVLKTSDIYCLRRILPSERDQPWGERD